MHASVQTYYRYMDVASHGIFDDTTRFQVPLPGTPGMRWEHTVDWIALLIIYSALEWQVPQSTS